jgi:aldose 1-epimerase
MNIINEDAFKGTHNGKQTALVTLKNKNGLVAQITNYGAIVVSMFAPDRNGNLADVVQGYDSIKEYTHGNKPFMGAIVGRCANRIGKAKFTLNKKTYAVAANDGSNHLHGGKLGYDKVVWDIVATTPNSVKLEYLSKNGDEGYPGNAKVGVLYTLTDKNELRMDFEAVTDEPTVMNLANHSYFNLAGEGSGDMLNQELQINAYFYTPTDDANIPTGEILSVKGTPMDFTVPKKIGKDINQHFEQLKFGNGYDHNFVLNHHTGTLGLAAVATDPQSGRVMEVYTTQPGVQLYTGNWLDNEKGKGGKKYQKRWAFCLETQHFADAINKPHFPSVILNPGEVYKHVCIYKFSAK